MINLPKICGSKVGIIVNNKFNTICVFLSYSYIFNDVTVKDVLLKVIFYGDQAKLLFSFRFNCDNKQTFGARSDVSHKYTYTLCII